MVIKKENYQKEALKPDEEIDKIVHAAEELKRGLMDSYKHFLDELGLTQEEFEQLCEDKEGLSEEELDEIANENRGFKDELEKIYGIEETKSILENIETEKNAKGRKKMKSGVKGSRSKWIHMR